MVSCRLLISDFANMFSSFIDSTYLAVPFAFRQSGFGIGIFILVTTFLLTEHCCNLIVICKRIMLKKIYAKMPLKEDGTESVEIVEMKALMEKYTSMGDIGEYTYGRAGRTLVNTALFITQFGFCVSYFIFVGTTLSDIFPCTNKSYVEVNHDHNLTFNTTLVFEEVSSAPGLIFLILTPLPIFILFSLFQSVRKLGCISVIANLSILVGCVLVFCYIVSGFTVSETFVWANWETAPITLGIVISAFEGIGTILPIEGSMVGNKHNFRKFLIGGIGGVAFILSVFGVMGYLRYGDETAQILVKNIPNNSFISIVDATLVIGVIFIFPLTQVPVVTMIESLLFTRGGLLRCEESDETEPLIEKNDLKSNSNDGSSRQVNYMETVKENPREHMDKYIILAPKWQRAIVRILVVLAELGVAIPMRYKYAYVSSFTGALGSTFLGFIVPCGCHLRLAWHEMNIGIKIKDIFIVILGIMITCVSLVVTVKEAMTKSVNIDTC